MTDSQSAAVLSAAWRQAARHLGIEVIAPFELAGVSFVAFLPDFGGPQGMVIAGPTSSEDETTALADQGFYLSRVSETYAEFDRDQFAAALDDWGWYGPDERRPAWYTGTAWSS